MQPPKFLFLDINLQCNLKCKTCMYWTREEVVLPTHISIEQRSDIIAEFSTLNPQGAVVICGGEALMNPERYWPITRQCRSLGLLSRPRVFVPQRDRLDRCRAADQRVTRRDGRGLGSV